MTLAYVYKWTHLPSGKWYIGSRTAIRCHPNDGYYCSSKEVKPLIKASPNEWKREILSTGNPLEMLELETNCGKVGPSGAMNRWHFDNCKENL